MNVTFPNVLRTRPIVLTEYEVWSLSRVVGRDVLPELQAICAERYEVVTLGQLMRTLTATLSSQRKRIGSADCKRALPNGHYRTAAGSEMKISGAHSGISEVSFDWLEEPSACCECTPDPYEQDGTMHWSCDLCGGGSALLLPVTPKGCVR